MSCSPPPIKKVKKSPISTYFVLSGIFLLTFGAENCSASPCKFLDMLLCLRQCKHVHILYDNDYHLISLLVFLLIILFYPSPYGIICKIANIIKLYEENVQMK